MLVWYSLISLVAVVRSFYILINLDLDWLCMRSVNTNLRNAFVLQVYTYNVLTFEHSALLKPVVYVIMAVLTLLILPANTFIFLVLSFFDFMSVCFGQMKKVF